ncbi:Gfo/Idh/MocA family oxidoreductase [Echinicola marina]|uniref:Gfo/Idh/MocA family protein n=1 Tax=Echinicola marina TaxID=2859768 RepID=UPI001CF64B69|nr:Gfo/Idh/MocA family oxidoreductase [Echinicola marina]UCS92855.1 Gfo/Idh/MocA family oxidoreductase [Echinicola marina]
MGQKIKFGIIGTGAIAAQHAAAIGECEAAELVAVCSSNEERARSAEDKFRVKAYSNLDEFLAHPAMEVVCICTASGRHMEAAVAVARAAKHILVEKPIEINLERADRIIEACKENGVVLGVVFQNRFNKGYLQLKQAVLEGKLGKLLMGNAYIKWYREEAYYQNSDWKGTYAGDGGGALINQGIHTIDLLLDIMGEVEEVYGQVKTVLHKIEGEDLGTAVVNFKNGAMGNITAGTSLFPGYPERLEVYGTAGSVILEAGKVVAWNIKGQENTSPAILIEKSSGAADPMAIGHQLHLLQIMDMVRAIRENRKPLVTGEIAKQSLALIRGIYRSSREGRSVLL